MSEVTYRTATAEDVEAIIDIVRSGWPPGTPQLLEERHGTIGGKPWLRERSSRSEA